MSARGTAKTPENTGK